MDEASRQLVGEIRDPLPMRPGDPLRIDSEYVRLGTCNLFMFCEPLRGWRHVRVTDRRTKVDWAYALRDFLNEFYPHAEKVVLVMDNLNTHSPGSLLRSVRPASRSRINGASGDPLHPQARQLVEHRRMRIQHSAAPVFRSPHRQCRIPRTRSQCVAEHAKRDRHQHQLAIHYKRCTREVATSLSRVSSSGHRQNLASDDHCPRLVNSKWTYH